MSTILGSPLSIGGGGAKSGLNVFVQETQPTAQNGLWIKKAKNAVTGVLIDNQVKAADGDNLTLPGNWRNQGVSLGIGTLMCGVLYDGVIYGISNYTSGTQNEGSLKYDIATGIFSFEVSNYSRAYYMSNAIQVIDTSVFYIQGTRSQQLYFIDPVNKKGGRKYYLSSDLEGTACALLIEDDIAYTFIFDTNSGRLSLIKVNIPQKESSVKHTLYATYLNTTVVQTNSYGAGKIVHHGNLFFTFFYNILVGIYDVSTNISTSVFQKLGEVSNRYTPTMGYMVVGSMVLLIGTATTTGNAVASAVTIYDLETRTYTIKENQLTDELTRYSKDIPALAYDGYSVYRLGGYYGTGTLTETVMKYTATSNDLPTGTVWAHESTSENVTEMYKDKIMTLNLGIDKVLIQEADGLKVQPAAIIKNGVATDIGGGVTPEPTPLPELAGTWVLNERLYAPENQVSYTGSYTLNGSANKTQMVVNSSYLINYIGAQAYQDYNFSTNTWRTTNFDRTLIFPAGATASDEFRAWLASNATKQ